MLKTTKFYHYISVIFSHSTTFSLLSDIDKLELGHKRWCLFFFRSHATQTRYFNKKKFNQNKMKRFYLLHTFIVSFATFLWDVYLFTGCRAYNVIARIFSCCFFYFFFLWNILWVPYVFIFAQSCRFTQVEQQRQRYTKYTTRLFDSFASQYIDSLKANALLKYTRIEKISTHSLTYTIEWERHWHKIMQQTNTEIEERPPHAMRLACLSKWMWWYYCCFYMWSYLVHTSPRAYIDLIEAYKILRLPFMFTYRVIHTFIY